MKKLISALCLSLTFLLVPLAVTPIACTTTVQRKAVNTLFSVGESVDKSYKAYLDLVVTDQLSTNAVPTVAKAYATFQATFNAAVLVVASSTNAVAPPSVLNAAAGVTAAIAQAKGK